MCKVYLQAMNEVRKLQQNPELGAFRIHATLESMGTYLSPRTIGRILAANRLAEMFSKAIERHHPSICVLIGQAPGRNRISFERLATNLRDFGKTPDKAGNLPKGEPIVTDGPAAFWSTLPRMEYLVSTLNGHGIPAAVSNNSENHLCNQLLYQSLHLAVERKLDLRVGFVHVPLLPEQVAEGRWPASPFMPLEMTRWAFFLIAKALIARSDHSHPAPISFGS